MFKAQAKDELKKKSKEAGLDKETLENISKKLEFINEVVSRNKL